MSIYDLRGDSSSHLRGINSRLFVREESAYGEPYAGGLSYEDYYLGLVPGSVISKNQAFIEVDSLTEDKSYFQHQFGKKTTGGVYGFHLNCQTLNKIFLHALGKPNSNELDFDTDRKEFLDNGLGFLQVVDGEDDDGYVAYFSGNRIANFSLTSPGNNSLVNVLFTFAGKNAEFFDKKNVTVPTGTTRLVEKVFPSWNTKFSLTKGGNSYVLAFQNFNINVNNNPVIASYIDGTDAIQSIQLGRRQVSGSFTLPLSSKDSNTSTIQFIDDYFNKENFTMSFTCYNEDYVQGSDDPLTGDSVHITLPNVVFSADTVPRNINTETIQIDVEFMAYPPEPGLSEITYQLIPFNGG